MRPYGQFFAQYDSFPLFDALRGFNNVSDNFTNQSWNVCKECKTKVLILLIKEKQQNIIGHLKNCLVHNLLQLVLLQVWPNHHLQNLVKRGWKIIFFIPPLIRWSKLIFPGLTYPSFSKHFKRLSRFCQLNQYIYKYWDGKAVDILPPCTARCCK